MIHIDGSQGEGGGQVLRSSLTLALLTGQELRISGIRARRPNPGLRPQHLKAVEAAAAVGRAEVTGAEIGSTELVFRPSDLRAGRYQLDISTAGAATLVLQTVFLPLSKAGRNSTLTITGGTHVPWSPSFHYLDLHWLSFMRQMGFKAQLTLEQAGFYPQGGGRLQAAIQPASEIKPLHLTERGRLVQIRGLSAVANLDRQIAERQRRRVLGRLGDRYRLNDFRIAALPARFKGTLLLLLAEFEHSQCCYFALGALGKPAERVADEAIDALEAFLATDGAIDQCLADQLLLPLACASGPSQLRTSQVTGHLVTNAEIIRAFLPVKIEIEGDMGQPGLVRVEP